MQDAFFCLPRSLVQTVDYIGLPEYLQFFFLPVLKTAGTVILIPHEDRDAACPWERGCRIK